MYGIEICYVLVTLTEFFSVIEGREPHSSRLKSKWDVEKQPIMKLYL